MSHKGIMSPTAPLSEAELIQRVDQISGMDLAMLASCLGLSPPEKLLHHKGWAGQLLEKVLGADAGSLAEPDFRQIGVEMKTLPINRNGQPIESTYVCTVPLQGMAGNWASSWVRNKLKRVLWIPIEGDRDIPVHKRRIGQGILWSPNQQQETILRQDWEELMDMVCLGNIEKITAKQGVYLQIRPKAADSKVTTQAVGSSGEKILTHPRGFYLRTRFTTEILNSVHRQPPN
ncbi:MAG: DNA mismatch repair endonuclease MutH [Gammaproteobacteria bacterium]|nr:DNA mismatch repair endonuclease MutH [Gammaproteobacteria bacterium]